MVKIQKPPKRLLKGMPVVGVPPSGEMADVTPVNGWKIAHIPSASITPEIWRISDSWRSAATVCLTIVCFERAESIFFVAKSSILGKGLAQSSLEYPDIGWKSKR